MKNPYHESRVLKWRRPRATTTVHGTEDTQASQKGFRSQDCSDSTLEGERHTKYSHGSAEDQACGKPMLRFDLGEMRSAKKPK